MTGWGGGGGGRGDGGGSVTANNRLASLFNNELSLYSGRRKINILILLKLWELEGEAVFIYRQWKQRCLLNSTNLPKKVLHCGVGIVAHVRLVQYSAQPLQSCPMGVLVFCTCSLEATSIKYAYKINNTERMLSKCQNKKNCCISRIL